MQPLPYHAGLAAHLRRRLPSITALSACSCPLHLSMSGEPLTQKQSSQFLPAVPGIRQCATRRTLAPGRPSHVPVVLHVLARRRCPIHPLQCARCTSPIMRRVRPAKVYRCAHDGAAARRGRGECEVPPLEIGVRAIQLSPYRAGLAGRHGTRLPVPPAFPTGSCPLQLSPSGKSMTQEFPFELLLTASRIQHRVPRRTVSLHPAQASQRPGDGPVSSPTTCWLHDT